MPKDGKEPQSYGSGADWVTGKTGQQVNDQKDVPAPEHRQFYDERHEPGTTSEDQGGKVSDVQLAESDAGLPAPAAAPGKAESMSVTGVTSADGGTKMDGYFRKRDYE